MSVTKEDKRAIKITVAIASPILLLYFCSQIGKPDPEIVRLGERSECLATAFAGKSVSDRCKEILESFRQEVKDREYSESKNN